MRRRPPTLYRKLNGSDDSSRSQRRSGNPSAPGPMHRGGVRFIDDHSRAIAIGQIHNFINGRNVPIHPKHRFSDNKLSALFLLVFGEKFFQRIHIQVRVDHFARTRQANRRRSSWRDSAHRKK